MGLTEFSRVPAYIPDLEPEISHLAYHIWQTAGRDFGQTALDFWAMAERMVIEMTVDSVRRANAAAGAGREEALARTFEAFSPTEYLEQIRQTAYHLWEAAENQQKSALEFWLAAEHRFMESLAAGGTAPAAPNAN